MIAAMLSFQTKWIYLAILVWATKACPSHAQTQGDVTVNAAIQVIDQIMAVPARQIPAKLLNQAHGVAIIPGVVKGGLVVGLRRGRGVVLTKDDTGTWHPPTFVTLTGGSVGWQAGLQSTDVLLVFKTPGSVNRLMNGGLKVGIDAAAAAGPVGREAEAATDATLSAEIYSYSRSRGLFAGVSLEGSVLQVDQLAGRVYYQNDAAGGPATIPASAMGLMERIARYSGSTRTATTGIPTAPAAASSSPQFITPRADMARQQLIASWSNLSRVLDDQWKVFLALPSELVSGSGEIPAGVLDATLDRYSDVAGNPQYARLAQSREFTTTYQLLRDYVTQRAVEQKPIVLPPPPTINNATNSRGRF